MSWYALVWFDPPVQPNPLWMPQWSIPGQWMWWCITGHWLIDGLLCQQIIDITVCNILWSTCWWVIARNTLELCLSCTNPSMYNWEFISCTHISVFIPSGAETGIFQENKVKIMAAEAVALSVARAWTAMPLTMQNNMFCNPVERFQLTAPSLFQSMV